MLDCKTNVASDELKMKETTKEEEKTIKCDFDFTSGLICTTQVINIRR